VGALFAAFAAALLSPLSRPDARASLRLDDENKSPLDPLLDLVLQPAGRGLAAVAAGAVMLALGLAQIHHGGGQASLSDFSATDDFDDLGRRRLPARAVLVAHSAQTIFAHWGGEVEDALRPDVLLVPIPFLSYPGMAERLIKQEPALKDLLRGHLLGGELDPGALQSLAAKRPVLLEMDVRVPQTLYGSLAPAGFYYAVFAGGATTIDERLRARAQRAFYRRLYERLGADRRQPDTRKQLIWHHFNDALYYMGYGDPESARASVRMAKNIEPRDRVLNDMEKTLADDQLKGPLDVTPFIKSIRQ
jgi:hypothetical protein